MKLKNIILLLTFLASVNLHAQYSEMVSQHAGKYFKPVNAEFSLSDIATTLSCNAATLASDFNQWQNADDENPWNGDNLLYLVDPVNGEIDTYTMDGNGFYLNRAGGLDHWGATEGNAGVWYVFGEVDSGNDLLKFNIGMSNELPETIQPLASLEQVTCNLVLKYNGRQATFSLTLNVTDPIAIPTPTTIVESELNVVGSKQVLVEQYPRSGWNSDLVTVVLDDIQSKLNIDKELLVNELDSLLYCTQYNNAETVAEGQGLKMAELSNHSTAGEPGFWLAAIMDEGGEFTGECSSVDYNGGVERKFFIEQFVFNAETNELTCRIGQKPNALAKDENYFVNIYLIYGSNAYRVRYNLSIKERPAGTGMANYVKKGETEVLVEQVANDNYMMTSITPNLNNIAATLGCAVTDLQLKALDATGNFAASTASNDGWWFTNNGFVTSWGQSASFYIEPSTSNNYSILNVCQMPNALNEGDEVSANLYFMASEDSASYYYQYKVTLRIVPDPASGVPFECIALRTINAQTVITNDYSCSQEKAIDLTEVTRLLGTSSPVLYGLCPDDEVSNATNGGYTKEYTASPYPGFYLTDEGRIGTWGDNNTKAAVCYLSNGAFRFYQKPGKNAVGDIFKARLFLVNEDTGKMIGYNLGLAFVDEIIGDTVLIEPLSIKLELDSSTVSLPKNSTITLNVSPALGSKNLTWTSGNETIAVVEDGVVTGKKSGTVNIFVSALGCEPDTCVVTVTTSPVSGIQLSESTVTIHKGLTHQLVATVLPLDAGNTNVIWSSTDETVATVDENGLVTAVGKGTAMIIALTEEGYKSAMCTVTVDNVVTAVTFSSETLTLAKGTSATLTASCTPADADDLTLTWSSSDETVATVDGNGLVTAIGKGTATITVTAATGVSATCIVTVTNPMTSFRFANATLTLQKGSSQALTLVPTPADADPVTLVWSSTDETVATVDENGVLTAIDLGTTVIVAYSPDINKSATCVVTVTKKDITLTDGTPYANDTEEECGTITYTRTFNNTNFQALYVPFEMTYADWQADFEVYYIDNIRQHDDNGDGVIDRTMMDIFLLKEGSSLYANMPYVIRAKTTGEKTITLTNATLYPAEENSLECSSTSMRYTITGTYEGVSSSMMDSNSWYALGGGSLIQTDGSNDLGAFRWYLSAESKGGVFKNSLPNEIKLQVINDDETGVESMDDEQWKMDNNAVYDLSGRHIVNYKSSNRQIPSGIYIRNGRKVVIK